MDLDLSREWLLTNGIGGYASSTVACLNTRRYHGLLIAATQPPVGRVLMLSKLEETLNGIELSANQYPGVIHPEGFRYLRDFRHDPFPIFTYEVNGTVLEKRICMVQAENTTVIEYELLSREPATLELRPLIAFRDHHGLTHENPALVGQISDLPPNILKFAPYPSVPPMYLECGAGLPARPGYGWYRNFEYSQERSRGLDFQEDLYNPAVLTLTLQPATPVRYIASTTSPHTPTGVGQPILTAAGFQPAPAATLAASLTVAAHAFLVRRSTLHSILAGYHWFSDWGRDTMIALPGLTLVTGRHEAARDILQSFSDHIDQGMLPNRFPDAGDLPEYNTVDATLWFFEAIRAYGRYTNDYAWIRRALYDKLKDIVDWHQRGTRYNIRVDSDGLLACGQPGVQLTWMDAKVGDWVVTPRHGKPVEIQALWHHALRILEEFARRFRDIRCRRVCCDLAVQAARSFQAQFWNPDAGCLHDVINGTERDASIRPNQIFAVSLAHPLLDGDRARQVVKVVDRELRTPMGLRTLSAKDRHYRGRYEGDVTSRDGAYHQGTVWPWLLGPFITAYVKVNPNRPAARAQAAAWLDHFQQHLQEAGLGQICEIADGDPPHTPRGCIAQAWSVAELLRALREDVCL